MKLKSRQTRLQTSQRNQKKMKKTLCVLLVEDSDDDALLLVQELRRGGYVPTYERVDTAIAMREALARKEWDVIFTDQAMPNFSASGALTVLQESNRDIPLLLVSGHIAAEQAIQLLQAGVRDYINKSDLSRLVPAVERELRQVEIARQRRQVEEELRLLSTAVATIANAIFITNQHGEILWTNAAFCRLSGFSAEELSGKNPRILKSGVQSAPFYEHVWQTILCGQPWTGEVVERHKDGSLYTVLQTITPLHDKAGQISHFVAIHEDITRRKKAEARVEHMAYHDALTGLPNRVLFYDRLAQAIAQAKRNARLVGVLFVDLDRFKAINDALGHAGGDLLLQKVAGRLKKCVRASDSVARLGGDEFAVVQTDLASVNGAAKLATKVLDALSQPFQINGQKVHSNGSVGITVYPLDDPVGNRLLENADLAMYRAKTEGRNRYAFFTASLDTEVRARREIEMGLTQALAEEQLVLHYQPQVDLNTRSIIGMEALVRWQHPARGLLMPGAFLPAAETSGLIIPLSEYVIRQGCKQNHDWQAKSSARVRLAINISASHLRNEMLLQTVTDALKETGLESRYLELELTETALIRDEDTAAKVIGQLARMGILISIDDFGTGYSSLRYLKHLSIQKIKIDQSFVRNLPHDPDDAVIVRATIALGHQLGLRVIAEGVETDDQFIFLREHRCDEGQGYFFYRPLPPDAMGALLEREGMPFSRFVPKLVPA
jgi:diguanylate cyclase (GGDEF)-like protein/PAS domain S-box-containing protein